uniref:Uncharacterized protein n=1 Tax=Cucumis melo TaxID=3656 RepID=A0A9I9E911_CUCME
MELPTKTNTRDRRMTKIPSIARRGLGGGVMEDKACSAHPCFHAGPLLSLINQPICLLIFSLSVSLGEFIAIRDIYREREVERNNMGSCKFALV